jgi:transcriptional regulator with XRE-family HTH domain
MKLCDYDGKRLKTCLRPAGPGIEGCAGTYIGQVERGERNLTLLSMQKFARGFKIELAELFKGLG